MSSPPLLEWRVRTVRVDTPMHPGAPAPVAIREAGAGPAVLILHGGWGYEAYPFDEALRRLAPGRRVIAPDRTGYGGSPVLAWRDLPPDFHVRFAAETVGVMDALGIDRSAVWGHSDGAVVAAWMAILWPDRVRGLVLEAFHHRRAKVGSLPFFRTGATAPEGFGSEVVETLRRDHGETRWREIVSAGGRAWLDIIEGGLRDGGDLFGGRLRELRCPVLFLHGSRDPRTEPGEIEEAVADVGDARLVMVDAGHAPHVSARSGDEANRAATEFLAGLPP